MRVALIGYGKMGHTIEELLSPDEQIVLKVDVSNLGHLRRLPEAEVAIEFSTPQAAVSNILKCFKAGTPVVCGTTGWYDHLEEVRAACKQYDGALLYAPNFSIGVNLFFELNERLAKMMDYQPQYNATVEETHHVNKKDAPSGTAIRLAEQIIKHVKRKSSWVRERSSQGDELIVLSHREGEVPGTHIVRYISSADDITLEHKAYSRQGFGEGAISAARWLIGKKGIFTMADMLNDL